MSAMPNSVSPVSHPMAEEVAAVWHEVVAAHDLCAAKIAEKRPDVLDFAHAISRQNDQLRLNAIARSTEHLCRKQLLTIAALCVAALAANAHTGRAEEL